MKNTTTINKSVSFRRIISMFLNLVFILTLIPAITLNVSAANITYKNLSATIDYANKYSLNYNPAYRNQNPDGGDCANFVSQALFAGGFPTDSQWQPYTSAWSYVPTQINYFQQKWGAQLIHTPKASDISVGDLVYYDWFNSGNFSHVTICVAIKNGIPLVDSHNTDRYQVQWNYGYSNTRYAVLKMGGGTSASQPTPIPSSTSNPYPVPTRLLYVTPGTQPFMQGSDVKWLQWSLNNCLGYNCGVVDGIFGNETEKALIRFQRENNLDADGVCGQQTVNKIKSLINGSTPATPVPQSTPTTSGRYGVVINVKSYYAAGCNKYMSGGSPFSLPLGARVIIINSEIDETDGVLMHLVKYNNQEGWISSRYLKLE